MSGKKGMRSELLRVLPAKYNESFVSVLDGRSRLAREVRARLRALIADLGGEGALSHAQSSLARRAVWLEIVIEGEELRVAEGGGIDIQPHTQLVGGLLAIYKSLGLKRQCRDVRLHDVLAKGGKHGPTNG